LKALGIDPGTLSFSIFGLDEDRPYLEIDIPTSKLASKPEILLDTIIEARADIIAGPSGYGLPLIDINDVGKCEEFLLILAYGEDKEILVLKNLINFIRLSKKLKLPMLLIPGVIHLPTVPKRRKYNKVDLGTADKLSTAVLAVYEESILNSLDYDRINLIVAEVGGAYTTLIAIKKGKIVDGIGGSQGPIGFMSHGRMDGEVAYLLHKVRKKHLFQGGIRDIANVQSLDDFFKLVEEGNDLAIDALKLLTEEVHKFAMYLKPSIGTVDKIVLSGRLTSYNAFIDYLMENIRSDFDLRILKGFSSIAKIPAQGAAIIANGVKGGIFKDLIEHMEIHRAGGRVLDYVLVGRIEIENLVKKYCSEAN